MNKEEMREKVHILFYTFSIVVLHLKEWLPILDGSCATSAHALNMQTNIVKIANWR
jgi:hypothetical protein